MTELLKALKVKLETITSRAYYDEAPANAKKPYAVYSLSSVQNPLGHDAILTINVWGDARDLESIEQMVDQIADGMEEWSYIGTGIGIYCHERSRMGIPTVDSAVRRREIRFDLKITTIV